MMSEELLPSSLVDRPIESIVAIRDRVAAGDRTCEAFLDESRRRIERIDPYLKSFVRLNPAQPETGDPRLPLAGIAVGVKDLFDTAGLGTSYGSPIYRDHRPTKDAALVTRLKSLGAHVIGKTVTTEFAWRHAGPTVNPLDPLHTPGGSSSGSAAAVAAGLIPLAIGTQTFGSVIRPAAFCGVVGFKPTHGLLPLDGAHPLSPTLDHAGFFTRSAQDAAFVFASLAAGESIPAANRRRWRIRLVHGPFWPRAEASQRAVLERAAAVLRRAGASVDHGELSPSPYPAQSLAETILCIEASAIYAPVVARYGDMVSGHIRDLVFNGQWTAPNAYVEALAARQHLQRIFSAEMGEVDAILTIPALGEAPLLTEGTGDAGPCVPWSLLGSPAITLPFGLGERGLPLGIQLIAAPGRDGVLLELARWCEEAWKSRE